MVEVPPMGSSFDRVPNLIIKTRERQVKLQCMTMEAHRRWVKVYNAFMMCMARYVQQWLTLS